MFVKTRSSVHAVILALILVALLMAITACSSLHPPDTTSETEQETEQESEAIPESQEAEETQTPVSENSFEQYMGYLGMTREQLKSDLGTPSNIDEGGLEFQDADIRAWFENEDDNATSISVWMGNPEVDFNGVKRGESINRFREVFGVPLSDNTTSAEAIFAYKQVWLIVDYDPNTGKTVGVYLSSPANPNIINPITESTPAEIQNTMGITMNVPQHAQGVRYAMIDAGDGKAIAQALFTVNGNQYTYRIRPATVLEDISGAYYSWKTIKAIEVSYCSGEVRYNQGEQGVILWYDAVPGLMYSVFTEHGASEESLLQLANELYVPAKDAP